MSRIYLIRHGSTEANLRRLYCGSTDLPLSEPGKQALRLLHYEAVEAEYLTSGMRRTDETMAILFPGRSFRREPAFREIDFGAFEMHSYEELKEDPDYIAWISGDNHRNVPPGGESGEQMTARVLEAFRDLSASDKDTVLVTHGGVIAAIMAHLYPEEEKNLYEWQPAPGHGYVLEAGKPFRELTVNLL